ncbi:MULTISPECIES: PLP-dependent aminotransferase family protein [Hydrocarboniphaga]|uniref:aminotransferase-like domain-containing protein n=1 Tax=Hydrocarboniphaga TaxID=243627 RepID=UPI002AB8BE3C|nr:PLP-dependent aminotransferase family protein [Hydrocarboniphaga sp.]MDZ4077222.1 PLP-dependent aminotransferase family protein [Hydrocarboniphaga sp.]
MTLYKAYADEVAALIDAGALKPGQRMPSVREASRHRGLSVVTMLKAYHLLEARGRIVARERSGYFVSSQPKLNPLAPAISQPLAASTAVEKADLIHEVIEAVKQRNVVPLGSAFPSPQLFPFPRLYRSLCRGVRELDPWQTVSALSPGNAELRRQIALRYHIDGLDIGADDLVVTDGAMEALNLCLQAVTRPGDTVVIESPTFYVALQALERLGLRAVEVATHADEGIDLDALAQVLQTQKPAACWLMTSFQNPLGALMPDDKKRKLVELLEEHGVPLIEDDVYGELHYSATRPPPAKTYDRSGNVLHCASFSKCLAPGYRVGWAAPGRYLATVQRLKLSTTLSTALPSQLALADYLNEAGYDRHLRQLRSALHAQRDAVIDAVREFFPAGTRVTRPQGGYFLWVELPRGTDTLRLHQLALAQRISLAPGAIFSARDDFAHCIRLNYGHPDDRRINKALRTLGKLAAQCT